MFGLMDEVAQGRVPALKLLKLKTDLPLNLHLVDLGDGLAGYDTPVPPEKIISRPMRALWRGISHPGITWAGPVPVNVGGFLQVLGQSAIRPPEQFWDKTYAIVGGQLRQLRLPSGLPFPKRGQLLRRSAGEQLHPFHL